MKKLAKSLFIISVFLVACQQISTEETQTTTATEENSSLSEEQKQQLLADADKLRAEIEAECSKLTPSEIKTDSLREQIHQKWAKIHYYNIDGKVVKIRTYPHENISERFEEFYFKDGKLVVAVINDKELKENAETRDDLDKMYYFGSDGFVDEINHSSEKETQIRHSDAERLQQEVEEYLEFLPKR